MGTLRNTQPQRPRNVLRTRKLYVTSPCTTGEHGTSCPRMGFADTPTKLQQSVSLLCTILLIRSVSVQLEGQLGLPRLRKTLHEFQASPRVGRSGMRASRLCWATRRENTWPHVQTPQ